MYFHHIEVEGVCKAFKELQNIINIDGVAFSRQNDWVIILR